MYCAAMFASKRWWLKTIKAHKKEQAMRILTYHLLIGAVLFFLSIVVMSYNTFYAVMDPALLSITNFGIMTFGLLAFVLLGLTGLMVEFKKLAQDYHATKRYLEKPGN